MKRKPTRSGRRIIQQIASWLAFSDQRQAQGGPYVTKQEIGQAKREVSRLSRARQHIH